MLPEKPKKKIKQNKHDEIGMQDNNFKIGKSIKMLLLSFKSCNFKDHQTIKLFFVYFYSPN